MATANPNVNPIAELGALLPGDALERLAGLLAGLLADPNAVFTCGQLARLGAAFSSVGATLTGAARAGMRPRLEGGGGGGRAFEAGVLFQWRKPGAVTAVDTQRVRAAFPPALRPDLYTTRSRRGWSPSPCGTPPSGARRAARRTLGESGGVGDLGRGAYAADSVSRHRRSPPYVAFALKRRPTPLPRGVRVQWTRNDRLLHPSL